MVINAAKVTGTGQCSYGHPISIHPANAGIGLSGVVEMIWGSNYDFCADPGCDGQVLIEQISINGEPVAEYLDLWSPADMGLAGVPKPRTCSICGEIEDSGFDTIACLYDEES